MRVIVLEDGSSWSAFGSTQIENVTLKNEKIYDVISVEKNNYRIIDDADGDYLFSPDDFEVVEE